MFKYTAKTTFQGWNLGLENYNEYVGVPKKYLFNKQGTPRTIEVEYQGEVRKFGIEDEANQEQQLQQLDTPAPHILSYFLWVKKEGSFTKQDNEAYETQLEKLRSDWQKYPGRRKAIEIMAKMIKRKMNKEEFFEDIVTDALF